MAKVRFARISTKEARRRALAVRLLLADCDGVLTDTGVYYGDAGELMKRFSIRDGMGVERLRKAGIECGIISGERSSSISRRAEKLGLQHVLLGVKDKRGAVEALCTATGLQLAELAFIGDDVNDVELLEAVGACGLTAAPLDALPEVVARAHHRCRVPGGQGALRDFAEWLLALRGTVLHRG
jgi:3-deoxy-D-manno-octulosonate 8-phosphate phosphatase (KDO 8-P phosphatase)